jgi:hypothetical protein
MRSSRACVQGSINCAENWDAEEGGSCGHKMLQIDCPLPTLTRQNEQKGVGKKELIG